jgi:hypothetical protein
LPGADRAEESVFRENPHGVLLLPLRLDISHLRRERTESIAIELTVCRVALT